MLIVVSHPRIATRYTSLSAAYRPGAFFLVSVVPRRLSIVPRKQNVKSEDVIKESLEASWDASSVWTRNLWFSRQPPLIIPPLSLCLRLPFPIRLARSFHLSLSFSFSFFSLISWGDTKISSLNISVFVRFLASSNRFGTRQERYAVLSYLQESEFGVALMKRHRRESLW